MHMLFVISKKLSKLGVNVLVVLDLTRMTAHLVLQKKRTHSGKAKHPLNKCPVQDAECCKCHKKGHYSSLYMSKRPSTSVFNAETTEPVKISEIASDKNFLRTVTRCTTCRS